MKELKTHCGKLIQVDDDVFEKYKDESLNWCHNAVRPRFLGRSLAALILNLSSSFVPDHIDGNPLNCQRLNLRPATRGQNTCNQKRRTTNTTGYKGVSPHKHGKFQATICYQYKVHYLGLFNSVEEAALAYNKAAKQFHGEFARLNSVEENLLP